MAKKLQFEPELDMPEFDMLTLSFMRTKTNPDGSIGHVLKAGAAADEWERYFRFKKLTGKASFLRQRVNSGQGYMVPTEWPDEYDPNFRRRGSSWIDRSHPDNRKD